MICASGLFLLSLSQERQVHISLAHFRWLITVTKEPGAAGSAVQAAFDELEL